MGSPRKVQKPAEAESTADEPVVQAWAELNGAANVSPKDARLVAEDVLKRVQTRVGEDAKQLQVLPNLGAFIVSAKRAFIQELERQPEIKAVRPTKVPEMTLIRPVRSRTVRLPAASKSAGSRPSRRVGARKK